MVLRYLTIFCCCSVIFTVSAAPLSGWKMFGDGDNPFINQNSMFTRITTINNNNITYHDESKHVSYNLQQQTMLIPTEKPTAEDIDIF